MPGISKKKRQMRQKASGLRGKSGKFQRSDNVTFVTTSKVVIDEQSLEIDLEMEILRETLTEDSTDDNCWIEVSMNHNVMLDLNWIEGADSNLRQLFLR